MAKQTSDTSDRILDVAERLIQTLGYNAFSYADIAKALNIRKASIHHHFPTKAKLGRALMARYRQRFGEALAAIERRHTAAATRLRQYAGLFQSVLEDGNRLCLCGMLAADFSTLPKAIRVEVRGFFDDNETWLERVLAQGRTQGSIAFDGPARRAATRLLSSLEGAMLVSRSYENPCRFSELAQGLLDDLAAA